MQILTELEYETLRHNYRIMRNTLLYLAEEWGETDPDSAPNIAREAIEDLKKLPESLF